jgi:hypothetical protein
MSRLFVSDDNVFKYFVEYLNTMDGMVLQKNQLTEELVQSYEECIAVQKGDWLPNFAYQAKKLSVLNTEQLCDPSVEQRVVAELKSVELKYGKTITVYDYSEVNCNIVRKHGFTCIYAPYNTPEKEREALKQLQTAHVWDVGFVGDLSSRRQAILQSLQNVGLRVRIVNAFGEERDRELAKCKYILNIHHAEQFDLFESIRCNRWIESGYTVVSETSRECPDSSNIVMVPYEDLVSTIQRLCKADKHGTELVQYIKSCLKPTDSSEFQEQRFFDKEGFLRMKQDGIAWVSEVVSEDGSDFVRIGRNTLLRRTPRPIEWLLEDGRIQFDTSKTPLYRRFLPPPIETVNHVFVISSVLHASESKTKTYVEYGVRNGTSIEEISKYVGVAHGVDICNYSPKSNNIRFHKMLTDAFSTTILPTISFDYAFIDADHSSSQVLVDFEFIWNHINVGGYIFLHDTYPCDSMFLRPDYCNDCYKTPLLIRERYPSIEMVTLPLNPGITIIRKHHQT